MRTRQLIALLLVALTVAACGDDDEASSGRVDGEADEVIDLRITTSYPPGDECEAGGPPEVVLHLPPGEEDLAWSGAGRDEAPDAIRTGDAVYVRDPIPGTGWVEIDRDPETPLAQLALMTAPGRVSPWLLDGSLAPSRSFAAAHEAEADGRRSLRSIDGEPLASELTWTVVDGEVDAVTIVPDVPEDSATTTYTRSAPAADPPEVPTDATPLADLPAVDVLMTGLFFDGACAPGTDPEASRACLEEAVGEATVGEWIAEAPPMYLTTPPACLPDP